MNVLQNIKENKYVENEKINRSLFKNDLLKEMGLLYHPKADKIFKYAWDQAHISGLTAVYHKINEIKIHFE